MALFQKLTRNNRSFCRYLYLPQSCSVFCAKCCASKRLSIFFKSKVIYIWFVEIFRTCHVSKFCHGNTILRSFVFFVSITMYLTWYIITVKIRLYADAYTIGMRGGGKWIHGGRNAWVLFLFIYSFYFFFFTFIHKKVIYCTMLSFINYNRTLKHENQKYFKTLTKKNNIIDGTSELIFNSCKSRIHI